MLLDWNEFKNDGTTPKDRRLLLITQPSGTPDGLEKDVYDIVVGHWSSHHGGFVQIIAPHERPPSSTLRVMRWADFDTPADLKLRPVDGLQ
jgi:hypothetical protein